MNDPKIVETPPKLGPITNVRRTVGRNEPCPFCTSGIKFKKCHGKNVGPQPAQRKVIE